MKDLDFLPDWYKDRRRRHSRMRKQYIALAAVFLMMMAFNLTATQRAARVAADVTSHAEQQASAESVVYEFDRLTKELNQLRTKADLVYRIDTRFDVAAILAEISHIVDESIVLSKIELVSEPFAKPAAKARPKGGVVGADDKSAAVQPETPLGNAKLRIVLAGVAIHPAHVADLVCRLDESAYFQQVRPSSYGKVQIPSRPAAEATGVKVPEMLDVTGFEITCYLANYIETEVQ
ncbi:MAG: hypothetical protein ABFE13_26225 [Phycisphaerales bacterium]